MTPVFFSSAFKRAFKKRIAGQKDLEGKFWKRVQIFTVDPFDPRLRTHKLSGRLSELWSFPSPTICASFFIFCRRTGRCLKTSAVMTKFIKAAPSPPFRPAKANARAQQIAVSKFPAARFCHCGCCYSTRRAKLAADSGRRKCCFAKIIRCPFAELLPSHNSAACH